MARSAKKTLFFRHFGYVFVTVVVTAIGTSACAKHEEASDRVLALAEKVYPDQIEFFSSDLDAEPAVITLAIKNDPITRIYIRAKQGSFCTSGTACEESLRRAYQNGIEEAQTLKSLEASFRSCGVSLLAVLTPGNEPTVIPIVELNLDTGNRERELRPLKTCLEHFQGLEHPDTLPVRIVPQLPAGPAVAPEILTFEATVPSARQYLPAYSLIATFEGEEPTLGELRFAPFLPLRFKIDEDISTAASAFLGQRTRFTVARRLTLDADRLDVVRGYILACSFPGRPGTQCFEDVAVALRYDLSTSHTSGLTIVPKIRDDEERQNLPKL